MSSNTPKATAAQGVTRSASNASDKLSRALTSTSSSLSVVDFNNIMAIFRKTEEETLKQC